MHRGQRRQPRMRQGDAMADTGGTEAFAFLKRIEDLRHRQADQVFGHVRDGLQQTLLAADIRHHAHGIRFQQ
jgi:hypothetical protein